VITDENLRKDLIEKGFNRAKAFSWEKCARETLAAIEERFGFNASTLALQGDGCVH
jgi:glycosyltransferase involved in cell wall biosynthesis